MTNVLSGSDISRLHSEADDDRWHYPSSNTTDPNRDGEHIGLTDLTETNVRRKPVPSSTVASTPYSNYKFTSLDGTNSAANLRSRSHRTTSAIYWVTPFTAIVLLLVGLAMAIGHHFFLSSLNNQPADNQVWTGRYSLAMAFIVKASLTAAVMIAYAQKTWHSLSASQRGTTIKGVDAVFTVVSAPLQFRHWDLWRSAPIPAIMAVAIWLLPLSAVVSPTSLTVGSLTQYTVNNNCNVPTLNLNNQTQTANFTTLALTKGDHTGNTWQPSLEAQRIVGLTLRNGQQTGWSSPCGANCSYEVTFNAPAWQCHQTFNIDNFTAVWQVDRSAYAVDYSNGKSNGSYWFSGYGDGSNISAQAHYSDLEYGPAYASGINTNTSQFWVGVSGSPGFTGYGNLTVQQWLNMHVYYCDLINATYTVNVSYINGLQTNTIQNVTALSIFRPSSYVWDWLSVYYQNPCSSSNTPARACWDAISLSKIWIQIVQGWISRTPEGESFGVNTTIGLVPSLIEHYTPLSTYNTYGIADLSYPLLNMGPLIEDLSHNISISLMSEPNLQVVTNTTTTCILDRTFAVWKYDPKALVIAYACAVGVALIALGIGGWALIANEVARDMSFSSIMLTTRNRELDELTRFDETMSTALPVDKRIQNTRLRFGPMVRDALGKDEYRNTVGAEEFRLASRHTRDESRLGHQLGYLV